MVSLDMKKFLNKTIAIKTATGVAASVAAMTAVNSAMSYTQAQDVVQHHAKEINDRSNVVAKILDIDRSKLVQKNYLKAAQSIDDYLTGVTNELHLDASMFNVDGSIEDESIFGVDEQSNEAFNRLNQQLASSISDNGSNSVNETFDLTKSLKETMTTSQDSNQLLDRVTGKDADKSSLNDRSVNRSGADESISDKKESNDRNQVNSIETDETGPKEATKKDQSSDDRIDHLKVASAVEDFIKSNLSNQDSQPSVNDRSEIPEISKSSESQDVKEFDRSDAQTKDQDSDIVKDTEDRVKDSEYKTSGDRQEASESIVDHEDKKDDSSYQETNLSGLAEINIHVRYNNNKPISDFKIVKKTTGVRRADGSETWDVVTFDRSDLPQEFLSDEIWKKADLLNPDFSSSYIPTSSDFKVSDKLTMRAKTRSEIKSELAKANQDPENSENTSNYAQDEETRKSSRTINLKKPNGEILKTIVQSEDDSEYQIPKTIDDWFVSDTSVIYSDEDIDVLYQDRYKTVEEIIDYSVTDTLDGRESTQKSMQIKSVKKIDNLDNQILESNEDSEARKIVNDLEPSYSDVELESTEINTEDKKIFRKYRSIRKSEAIKSVNKDQVNDATDKLISSMPTVSNRAEYSKYTSINDQFGHLLERESIEKCVFDLSEGSYNYQESGNQLRPSKETVSLLELNKRVTDRLIERINEYRRLIGLSEVTAQPLTLEQERMFASHAIYNYLADNHSISRINDEMMKMINLQRLETMQPVHKIKVANQSLTPEAVADSLFRAILNETRSYVDQDGGETGHLEQLLDPDIRTVYAGMFIGSYEQVQQTTKMFGKSIDVGLSNEYTLSTTLQYFK